MVSIALKISDEFKAMIDKLPWVNWSELAREEAIKQEENKQAFEKFKKIVSKSKFSENDAEELANKVKFSMHKKLKHKGLL